MKKFIIILLLLISTLGYSQPKYYACLSPNIAFNTPTRDTNNLLGVTLEVGKYIGTTAVGITTGYYSLNSQDLYSELLVTVPLSSESAFTVSGGLGWFYFRQEITMEYDINYGFKLNDTMSLILTLNNQSAFGTTSTAFCIGLNKDF